MEDRPSRPVKQLPKGRVVKAPTKPLLFSFSQPNPNHLHPFAANPGSEVPQGHMPVVEDSIKTVSGLTASLANFKFGAGSKNKGPKAFSTQSQLKAKIKEIENQIHTLEWSTLSRDTSYTAQIVALRRQRNELLPIETIPPEVFIDIIREAQENSSRRLVDLSHVSHWWRSVIVGDPSLWNLVQFRCRSAPLAVQRSAQRPIDIRIRNQEWQSINGMKQFMSMIAPESYRWRSLEYEAAPLGFMKYVEHHLNQLLPELESLVLNFGPAGLDITSFLPGPSLKHLRLRGGALSWENTKISGMKTLSIAELLGSYAPSVAQLLEILASCPQLEELHLESLDRESDPLSTEFRPVTLPLLRVFTLTYLTNQFVIDLMQSIRAENLTTFQLYIERPYKFDNVLRTLLEQSDPACPAIAALSNGGDRILDVWSVGGGFNLSFSRTERRMLSRLPPSFGGQSWELARRYAALVSKVHLRIGDRPVDISYIDSMPNLIGLSVADRKLAPVVIDYLFNPVDGEGPSNYPCKRLESLRFIDWCDVEALDRMAACPRHKLGVAEGYAARLDLSWTPTHENTTS